MKQSHWLQVIGFGANVAVVAGLVFVGLEVRNGRAAAEAQIADGIADGFIQTNMAVIQDAEMGCIFRVGLHSPDALTLDQAARFSMYFRALFNQYIRVHDLYSTGFLEDDTWRAIANQAAWMMETPGGRLFFEGNSGLTQRFVDAIASHAGSSEGPDWGMGRPIPAACDSA